MTSFYKLNGQVQNSHKSNEFLNKPGERIEYKSFLESLVSQNSAVQFVEKDVIESKNKYEHHKFFQTHEGLKILGSEFFIHVKNDVVISSNGKLHNIDSFEPSKPIWNNNELEKVIYPYLESTLYANNNEEQIPIVLQSIEVKEYVIADKIYPSYSGSYVDAAVVEVEMKIPFDKRLLVLDLHHGKIIHDQSVICEFAVEGRGKTKYYGEQTFIVDSLGPNQFQLRDPIRNITTYSAKTGDNLPYFDEDNYWDLTNEDMDEVALDAHYCASKFHDMMVDLFDYRGLDGNGQAMDPVVHVGGGAAYLNAFWNGTNAFFGNGDCHHNPLTTLSVVGHEFMHGVTDYTSDLIYANESGAINESMSDIFGKSLEYFIDNDNFSWELGPEFGKTEYSRNFRDMSNPNLYDDPALYLGEFWDFGGAVHTNSGVFNYWFYLMVEGELGVNEKGEFFNVKSQPIEDVLQVVWLCQSAYLTPSSTYPELYEYSLEAVEELFGTGSEMMNSVQEAWKAVGLPYTENAISYDLAVEARVEDNSTCYQDHDYTILYSIYNLGNTTVNKDQDIEVRFNSNSGLDTIVTITLDNELLPSEKVDFSYPNAYTIDDDRIYFYNINLIVEDSVTGNNFAFGFLRNFTEESPQIELINTNTRFEKCFSNDAELEFSVFNKSCAIIPSGTEFTVVLENAQEEVLNKSFTINQNMNPNSRITYTEIVSDLEEYDNLGIRIVSSDVKFNPGRSGIDVLVKKTITGEYLNTFDDDSFRDDFSIFNLSGPITYEFDNDNYFAALGTSRGMNRVPCPEVIENLDEVSFGEITVEGCIDLSMIDNPLLSFDLVQFRYDDSSYDVLEENTTIMRVSYLDENSNFNELIHNQEEGLELNHSYSLPSNFKGEIFLEFFSHFGNNGSTALEFDANLMDNFRLTSGPSSIEEVSNQNNVKVVPNPGSNWINIWSDSSVKSVEVYNVNGQLLVQSNQSNINISQLQEGLYFVKVKDQKNEEVMIKFIKAQ